MASGSTSQSNSTTQTGNSSSSTSTNVASSQNSGNTTSAPTTSSASSQSAGALSSHGSTGQHQNFNFQVQENSTLHIPSSSLVHSPETLVAVGNADHGTVMLSQNGQQVSFVPQHGYTGPADFQLWESNPQHVGVILTETVDVTGHNVLSFPFFFPFFG